MNLFFCSASPKVRYPGDVSCVLEPVSPHHETTCGSGRGETEPSRLLQCAEASLEALLPSRLRPVGGGRVAGSRRTAKHSRRFDAPSSNVRSVRHSNRSSSAMSALNSATEPPHPK